MPKIINQHILFMFIESSHVCHISLLLFDAFGARGSTGLLNMFSVLHLLL